MLVIDYGIRLGNFTKSIMSTGRILLTGNNQLRR